MSYSITCSTKILTLAIAPLLFILVDVLREFAMVPGVYILLSPQEEEVHYSSWGHRSTHSAAHSSKKFKPLSAIILLWEGSCWIGKNKQGILLCYSAYNLTKWPKWHFEIWFQWMSLSNLFLIKFEKFHVLYLGCGCMAWFYDADDFTSPLSMPMNK